MQNFQVQSNYICGRLLGETMVIGEYNFFEVGSYIESMQIGGNNVFESKSKVIDWYYAMIVWLSHNATLSNIYSNSKRCLNLLL